MNLTLLRTEIWHALGDPTDLNPTTDVQYNGGPLLNFAVNEAQRQVAGWKDPETGRRVHMPSLFNSMYFKSVIRTNSILTVNNVAFPYYLGLVTETTGDVDDRYNGWLVKITSGDANGSVKLITDSSYIPGDDRIYLHEDFDTTPIAADTLLLYKNFYPLFSSTHPLREDGILVPSTSDNELARGNLADIVKITDIQNNRVIEYAERTESFPGNALTSGSPTKWYRLGNVIYFDVAIEDERWFRAEYYRTPTELVNGVDEPEIPEVFHYGIVLWGRIWGYTRSGEPGRLMAAQKDFKEFMRSQQDLKEVIGERTETGGILQNA